MSDTPSTIKHPDTFNKSLAAGFDGIFDWSWTQGCFGQTKITPMDFDGVVERKGNFIVFETKGEGVPVPTGQEITLKRAHDLGVFTVMFINGKAQPESVKVWHAPDFRRGNVMPDFVNADVTACQKFVSAWYEYADKNPKKGKVDTSFLQRRIRYLSSSINAARKAAGELVSSLGGKVEWEITEE